MSPLHLWRIIEAEEKLAGLGGSIFNVNGLLNIYGWMASNDWHIVPHENLPREPLPAGMTINIPTNSIAGVREAARRRMDRRQIKNPEGEMVNVVKHTGDSFFAEDESVPSYVNLASLRRGVLDGVYMGKHSLWWCRLSSTNPTEFVCRVWDSAMHWLSRVAACRRQVENAP
jgi:hypothetical protein